MSSILVKDFLSSVLVWVSVFSILTFGGGLYVVGGVGWVWDSVSVMMVFLSGVIGWSVLNLSEFGEKNEILSYSSVVAVLSGILILSFSVSSVMGFFILFELSMLPIFLLVVGWGAQPERLSAGVYLYLYTFLGSFPLLVSMVEMSSNFGVSEFFLMDSVYLGLSVIMWSLAFFMKLPIFGVHSWLPKAHVEASVGGSMILAGVMLKLGGYGLFRVSLWSSLPLMSGSTMILFWCVGGSMVCSFICFRSQDLKSLVAFSSVVHMSVMAVGLWGLTDLSGWGYSAMMVGHGLASSGLFLSVGLVYEHSKSRSLVVNSGVILVMPLFFLLLVLLVCGKMSTPPTIKFFGEVSLYGGVGCWWLVGIGLLCGSIFMVGAYSVYILCLMGHGKIMWYQSMFGNEQVLLKLLTLSVWLGSGGWLCWWLW